MKAIPNQPLSIKGDKKISFDSNQINNLVSIQLCDFFKGDLDLQPILSCKKIKIRCDYISTLKDPHFISIAQMPALKILSLTSCDKITYVALSHLKDSKTLQFLELSAVFVDNLMDAIGDKILKDISSIPSLMTLRLIGLIKHQNLALIRSKLPKIKVESNSGVHDLKPIESYL